MAQITTDVAQARSEPAVAATPAGVLPWQVLAVLAIFVLGIEVIQ